MTEEPRGDRAERDGDGAGRDGDRPKLTRRDTWHLVFATYKASFPYILIFVVGMLVATWFVTTILFR